MCSCNYQEKRVSVKEPVIYTDSVLATFNKKILKESIRNRFNDENDTFLICHSYFNNFDTLQHFYKKRSFKPLWTKEVNNLKDVDSICKYFKYSYIHGLDSFFYDLGFINLYIEELNKSLNNDSVINYSALANIELLISNGLIDYINHVENGVINPKELYPKDYYLPISNKELNIFAPLKAKDINKYLLDFQKKDIEYVDLQKSLLYYNELERLGGWDSILVKEKIVFGDTINAIDSIARRLVVTGELDSIYVQDTILTIYDSTIYKAVIKFQERNGLTADGIIGNGTKFCLNVSVNDRIDLISANLERFKWLSFPDTGKYILINLPDYHYYAIDSGEVIQKVKICIGSKREINYDEKLELYKQTGRAWHYPQNHETPEMYGKINIMVVNPTWLVPKSIAEKETKWKILKDTAYFRTQNFIALVDGIEIDSDTIDWTKYKHTKLPFRLRQEPCSLNALGRIKFLFYNPFDIYLHDTPSKRAFNREVRAVSHGCMRVQEPLKLVEFVIEGHKEWTTDDVRIALGKLPENDEDDELFEEKMEKYQFTLDSIGSHETHNVKLKQRIPLYVIYKTAWVDNGNIHFRNDVYEKDSKLIDAIKNYR